MSGEPHQSQPGQRRVLVVDDDKGLAHLICRALEREGYDAAQVGTGSEAVQWLGRQRADLMLIDLKLHDMGGRELVEQLGKAGTLVPFIVITGQGDERVAVEMMKRGARDYVIKDVDFLQFLPEVTRRALERVEQEERLARAEQQVRLVQQVVEHGFSAVLITDANLPDPQVVHINPAFASATGYDPEQVVGKPLSALGGLAEVQQRLREGMPSGETFVEQVSVYNTPLGPRWGEWRLGPVEGREGQITHWLVIFRDITERKRLEKEILEISDRERQRLGQDLHDGLCQHLAGIELMSQVLEQKLAPRNKGAAARVGEIGRHVRDAIAQTRALARGLSPLTLESDGLSSGLQELAVTTEHLFRVKCRFQTAPAVHLRGGAVSIHLYRIAQEAVSNAIKHGKATCIDLRLSQEDNRVRLEIRDNGCGFPPVLPSLGGMGLRIMQYRAGMISGSLDFRTMPGQGAQVVCSVPI